jgi:hypothetical protein
VADLDVREETARIDPGDVFFTDPNYQVDPRLTLYTTRSAFAHLARETRRNYAGDCCLFFNFLWHLSSTSSIRGHRRLIDEHSSPEALR